MKSKRKLISFLTAFVMAFTVFGCTGASFATEDDPAEPAEVTALAEGDVLSAPANLKSVGGDKSVALSWDAVAPLTEGNTVSYVLTCDGVEYTEETAAAPTAEAPFVPNLTFEADKGYVFNIKAVEKDAGGNVAAESAVVNFDPAKTNPEGPASLDAPVTSAPTAGYRTITLEWQEVAPANGGTVSYELYDSNDEAAVPIKDSITVLIEKFTGLSPRAAEYKYFIKAVEKDADGNVVVKSDFAAFDPVKTKDFSTQKLTGLISDPGYKAVLLKWNRMDGATGYKIYWRIGGERGNIDNVGKDSDGHNMKTFRSKKTRKYEIVKEPGKYEYLTTVKNPKSGDKVNFDKRDLKVMNHTYVYFYQFMIIPYYDDDQGAPIYTSAVPENKWKAKDVNKNSDSVAGKSNLKYNIIRNNTVLPMYVLETAKYNKPIYKTCSMGDGKKRGRLHKGHKFICFDKANGRVKFYEKSNVSNPDDTFWFAQKNAHTIQGYYMNNGNKNDLGRKDWKTGYSKKTVLDFVNKSGLSSKTGYLIWVSKYAQHTYIFKGKKGHWKLLNDGDTSNWKKRSAIWSNLCTSGKVYIQSRNGDYVIFGKQHTAKRAKYTYYYLSKLHKTVRLHSLLHKKGQKFGGKLYNKALGNPVSKGCIRLRPKVSKWIYDNVPKKTRCKVW